MSRWSITRRGAVIVSAWPTTGAPGIQAVSGLPSSAWEARSVGRLNARELDRAVTSGGAPASVSRSDSLSVAGRTSPYTR
jgi:hypothetical protein